MLEVLVVEPTAVLRAVLEKSFTKFDEQMRESLPRQFPHTPDEALILISGVYRPTDLVIDTDVVPFDAYSEIISTVKKVRTFGLGERDSLAFHRHAKDCKLPYEFVMKTPEKINSLPYMIALNKQSC